MIPITACICTHNRPDYLADCLVGLRDQSVGPDAFRILVVDSGSAPTQAADIRAQVAAVANASLLRIDRPGLSVARNAAAQVIPDGYIAYLDDDAVPAPDWIAAIRHAIAANSPAPPMLGGAIYPLWEAPLPDWWPARLRGVLSVLEVPGQGMCGEPGVAAALEPYGANMIVHVTALRAAGGFPETVGRDGRSLLSDEEKILTRTLRNQGAAILYDSRILVHHQIQTERLTVPWLLRRMYWQGVSHVRSSRILAEQAAIRREAPRRLAVLALLAPFALIPARWPWLLGPRWRWAYARGFLRAYLREPAMLPGPQPGS
jgi:glycosyltransferase involved in cell wall biosynthesis